jgi:flagellar hook-associated protein 2
MALTATGIGSGLDVNSIVKTMVAAEGDPKKAQLSQRESDFKAKISALGSIKSAMTEFQKALDGLKSVSSFQLRSATSSNMDIVKVSATASAVAGQYSVEVLQLAQAQKLASGGFADANAVVGEGTLTIASASGSFSVTIDAGNSTLAGIRDAINGAADNIGVTASIANVDDGAGGTVSRLVLTSTQTGTAHAVTLSTADSDGNDTDGSGLSRLASPNLQELVAAQDAQFKLDGMTVTRSGNTITGAVDGLTFDLQKAEPGTTVSVGVSVDNESIAKNVQSFVDAYNKLQDTLKKVGSYVEGGNSGALLGDAMLRSLTARIRSEVTNTVASAPDSYNSLALVGVAVDRYGKMSLDRSKMDAAMAADPNAVAAVFANPDGVAGRVGGFMKDYLQTDGILDQRTKGLNRSIRDISDQRERLDVRLASLEARLFRQFNAMDGLVAQLNATGASLKSQLSALTSNNG